MIRVILAGLLAGIVWLAVFVHLTMWRVEEAPQLHPVDLTGAWLDPRYANGAEWIQAELAEGVSNDPLGIAPDAGTVYYTGHDTLHGVDLFTGTPKWVVEGVSCSSGSMIGEIAICSQQVAGGRHLVLIDGNGAVEVWATSSEWFWSPMGIAFEEDGDMLLSDVSGRDGSVLMSWPRGVSEPSWVSYHPASFLVSAYAPPYVIMEGLNAGYFVDASTGEVVGNGFPCGIGAKYASDGYVVANDRGGYEVFDVVGNSLGFTSDPFVAPESGGATIFSTADYLLGDRLPAVVDAQGNGLAYDNKLGFTLLGNGEVVAGLSFRVPAKFFSASADGSLILVQDYPRWTFIDAEGNKLFSIAPGYTAEISNGILYTIGEILAPVK